MSKIQDCLRNSSPMILIGNQMLSLHKIRSLDFPVNLHTDYYN